MRPLAVIGNVNVDLILGPAAPWPKAGTEIIVDHDELRVGRLLSRVKVGDPPLAGGPVHPFWLGWQTVTISNPRSRGAASSPFTIRLLQHFNVS